MPIQSRLHVLLCIHSASPGGAQLMALAAAERLARTHRVSISIPEGPLRQQAACYGEIWPATPSLPIWGASAARWLLSGLRVVRSIRQVRRLLVQRKVNVVVVNSTVLLAPVRAARSVAIPAVTYMRDQPTSRLAPLLFRAHVAAATVIVAISPLAAHALPTGRARVMVIPDGIPPTGPPTRRMEFGRPLRLVHVGGLEPNKGQDLAVEVVASLVRGSVSVQLALVGRSVDQQYADQLAQMVSALGLGDHVTLLGERDDVRDILDSSDILLLSSRSEWTPLSVLEALDRELPVVAFDIGSVREILLPDETGTLVPPEDPEAMAAAVRQLVLDPSRAFEMARRGREHVHEVYSQGGSLEELVRLVESLSAGATAQPATAVIG